VRRPALLSASLLAAIAVVMSCVGEPRASAADTPFSGVRVTAVTATSARVEFTTTETAAARAAYGLDAAVVWTPSDTAGTAHAFTLTGLHPDRVYSVWPQELQEGDPITGDPVHFRTAGFPASAAVTTSGGILRVDGQPFLPVLAYNACDPELTQSIHAGINVLVSAARPCGGPKARSLATQLATVEGHAFVVGNVDEQGQSVDGDALLGWYQVDEPDGLRQPASELPAIRAENRGKPTFLTVTGHFFADPFPWAGASAYRDYVNSVDVVGYDYYPLQGLCNRSKMPLVYHGQVALQQLAAGKPTFQWIEANRMEKACRAQPELQVTPTALRNEVWQAIAGGAKGIGFFPVGWDGRRLPAAIASVTRQLASLAPALLTAVEPVQLTQPADGPVVASARTLNDARYVVVVNTSYRTVKAKLVLGADDATREWTAVTGRRLPSFDASGAVTVTLPPLGAGVYVAAPQW
jgi:hypothetical protein